MFWSSACLWGLWALSSGTWHCSPSCPRLTPLWEKFESYQCGMWILLILLVFVASDDDDDHEDEDGEAATCSNSDQSGLMISAFSREARFSTSGHLEISSKCGVNVLTCAWFHLHMWAKHHPSTHPSMAQMLQKNLQKSISPVFWTTPFYIHHSLLW